MSLLIVGSFGLDTVETKDEKREDVLGGSAVFFSFAASFFAPVRVVGVVGKDWPKDFNQILRERNVDLSGVEVANGGTFRWHGRYEKDMNSRTTMSVTLGVAEHFSPKVPDKYKDSEMVFLGNCAPQQQKQVLDALSWPKFVFCDTIDLWIKQERDLLMKLIKGIQGIILNDSEVRLLTGESNLIAAATKALTFGPEIVVVKKGEHGSFVMTRNDLFVLPAFPLEKVVDPTGAGDSYAGGFMGYLAQSEDYSFPALRRAAAYGTVMASFCCEDFSVERFKKITRKDVEQRFGDFKKVLMAGY